MIRYSLAHLRFLEEQLKELDDDMRTQIEAAGLDKPWEELRTIPGIQQTSAATIPAETGNDMSQVSLEETVQFLGGRVSWEQPQRGEEQE